MLEIETLLSLQGGGGEASVMGGGGEASVMGGGGEASVMLEIETLLLLHLSSTGWWWWCFRRGSWYLTLAHMTTDLS